MVTKTSRKKWIGTVSKLHSSYSISFDLLDIDEMFWSWILKNCILVEKSFSYSHPQWNMKLGSFTLQLCDNGKEMYTKAWLLMQRCCFANLNLLLFCHSCCCCLSSPLYSCWNYFTSSALSIFILRNWQNDNKITKNKNNTSAFNLLIFVLKGWLQPIKSYGQSDYNTMSAPTRTVNLRWKHYAQSTWGGGTIEM